MVHSQVNSFQQLGAWRANLAYFPRPSLKKNPKYQLSQAVLVTFIHSVCWAFNRLPGSRKAPGPLDSRVHVHVCVCACTGSPERPGLAALQPLLLSHKECPLEKKPRECSFQIRCDTPHSSRKAGFGAGFPAGSGPHLRSLFPGAPVTGTAARLRVRARAGGEPGCGSAAGALPLNPRRAANQIGCAIRAVTRAGNRQRKRKKSPRQFAYRTRATPSRKLGEF